MGIRHRRALEFVSNLTLPPKILQFLYPNYVLIPGSLAKIMKFMSNPTPSPNSGKLDSSRIVRILAKLARNLAELAEFRRQRLDIVRFWRWL
jgi:hypothetical protein